MGVWEQSAWQGSGCVSPPLLLMGTRHAGGWPGSPPAIEPHSCTWDDTTHLRHALSTIAES